jgi:hypothetical protein
MNIQRLKLPGFALTATLVLSGCVASGYTVERQPLASPLAASGASAKVVQTPSQAQPQTDGQKLIYSLSQDFDRDPPACAVVVPADIVSKNSVLAADVALAVGLHLAGKLDRVIGTRELNRILRKQNLDLDHPGDARAFAWKTRCRAILTWKLTSASETFLMAYGARQIGLELILKRIGKTDVLWQARHTTSRSGGGLPLSPVGLVLDSVRTGQFMNDQDMLPSMINDVVRRLFTTLPDSF